MTRVTGDEQITRALLSKIHLLKKKQARMAQSLFQALMVTEF